MYSSFFFGLVIVSPEVTIERTWLVLNFLFIETRIPSSVSYALWSRRVSNCWIVTKLLRVIFHEPNTKYHLRYFFIVIEYRQLWDVKHSSEISLRSRKMSTHVIVRVVLLYDSGRVTQVANTGRVT
jgi:hypothetical protein